MNCARGLEKSLSARGYRRVQVNFSSGSVSLQPGEDFSLSQFQDHVAELGYRAFMEQSVLKGSDEFHFSLLSKFLFCLFFTIPLLLHMILPIHALHNPYVQLALCLPVFLFGCLHFGLSALRSLRRGVPNMDVLIFIGIAATFFYSLTGTL